MISEQTKHRVDVFCVLFFLTQELFDRQQQNNEIEQLAITEATPFPTKEGMMLPPVIPHLIFASTCNKGCCSWHTQAAAEILSDEKTKTDEAFEDGGIDAAFLRGLLERVFEKVAGHYKITPSTVADQSTRTFGNISTNEFFGIFLSGLHRGDKSEPSRITLALQNKKAGDETDLDIRNYVSSLRYNCIMDWLY